MKGNAMFSTDKFMGTFFLILLLGVGGLIYQHAVNRNDCVNTTLKMNYTPEQIRTVCR